VNYQLSLETFGYILITADNGLQHGKDIIYFYRYMSFINIKYVPAAISWGI
jgi:hypothetical protein